MADRTGKPHPPQRRGSAPAQARPSRPTPARTSGSPSSAATKKPEQPSSAAKPISPARTAAFDVLRLVAAGRAHSDELLHSSRLSALSTADKGLATALVMGVLRWQLTLDARLRPSFARPGMRVAEEAMIALRLGAYQLLHMDRIPAHAALSESVELCRWSGQPHAAGMVNAVLRRLLREPPPGVPIFETVPAFAERRGHPAWLAERWESMYGRDAARRICEAGQHEPAAGTLFAEQSATPSDGDGTISPGASWDAADAELAPTSGSRPLPVMDDGSRLVAELVAALLPETPGRQARVWDCCAAPGGKTMVLAHRLSNSASLLATDVSARRLAAMQSRLTAAGYPEVRCVAQDSTSLPRSEGNFDLILCDVPCSGTGTLARNPEIRHRLQPEDLPRQAERQHAILRAALNRLAPGGRLVYSTCSLEPEECEHVIDASLSAGATRKLDAAPFLRQIVTAGILGSEAVVPSLVRSGALRTLPGVHPCDGFYAAVIERT